MNERSSRDEAEVRRRRAARAAWVEAVGASVRRQLVFAAGIHEHPSWATLAYLYESYPNADQAATRYLSDHHLI